jgi:signal transduction histidine kinase
LAIEDNGIGFAADSVRPGIGDRLMKVFGRQVGGTVSVDSRRERGTRVELVFTLSDEKDSRARGPFGQGMESRSATVSERAGA